MNAGYKTLAESLYSAMCGLREAIQERENDSDAEMLAELELIIEASGQLLEHYKQTTEDKGPWH